MMTTAPQIGKKNVRSLDSANRKLKNESIIEYNTSFPGLDLLKVATLYLYIYLPFVPCPLSLSLFRSDDGAHLSVFPLLLLNSPASM